MPSSATAIRDPCAYSAFMISNAPLGAALLAALSMACASSAVRDAASVASEPVAGVCASVADKDGQPSAARAIHEERFLAIGGIEQWVTVHGEDCANPVVLFLHGGPGNTLS